MNNKEMTDIFATGWFNLIDRQGISHKNIAVTDGKSVSRVKAFKVMEIDGEKYLSFFYGENFHCPTGEGDCGCA